MPAEKATKATTVIPGLPGPPFGETGSPGVGVPPKQHLVVETLSVQAGRHSAGNQNRGVRQLHLWRQERAVVRSAHLRLHRPQHQLRFSRRVTGGPLVRGPEFDHLRGSLCSGWLDGNAVPDCIGIPDLTAASISPSAPAKTGCWEDCFRGWDLDGGALAGGAPLPPSLVKS